MFSATLLLALTLLPLFSFSKLVPPPSTVVTVSPQDGQTFVVANGTLVTIGWDEKNLQGSYEGLEGIMNMSVSAPNGTVIAGGLVFGGGCRLYPGSEYLIFGTLDAEGTYKARWDLAYGVAASDKGCDTGPRSYQNFTLESAFQVRISGSVAHTESLKMLVATSTRSLPSKPTGLVNGVVSVRSFLSTVAITGLSVGILVLGWCD